jgi:hypothetical protein
MKNQQANAESMWREFSDRHGLHLTAEEIGDIQQAASLDSHEGAEWLPYYKAALGLMAQIVGSLWLGIDNAHLRKEDLLRVKRQWFLHMVLGAVGPRIDDVSELILQARRDTLECFSSAEGVRRE